MKNNTIAYVGIGSNLAEPKAQVRQAIGELDDIQDTELLAASSLYRSSPLGPTDQPDYINAAVKLMTSLSAALLLTELFRIEHKHGRRREVGSKWGPRTLDLDLLLYGDLISREPALTLPHPGIAERVFVLAPLLEIEPEIAVPGQGPAKRLLTELGDVTIEKLQDSE